MKRKQKVKRSLQVTNISISDRYARLHLPIPNWDDFDDDLPSATPSLVTRNLRHRSPLSLSPLITNAGEAPTVVRSIFVLTAISA
jgi:hypothetical protein